MLASYDPSYADFNFGYRHHTKFEIKLSDFYTYEGPEDEESSEVETSDTDDGGGFHLPQLLDEDF